MKSYKTNLIPAICIATFFSSCLNGSNDPYNQESTEAQISEIKNIVWKLQKFYKNGTEQNISHFPPFHLIYDDDRFFGDDGCNWFGGIYEVQNDSIYPDSVTQTLRLCLRATFSIQHLLEPYHIQVGKDDLQLLAGGSIYTYKSEFSENIEMSPLVQNWQLIESTDSEFKAIKSQQLTPTLTLDQDRGFEIIWSCNSENTFECNQIAGVFGVDKDGEILFYQTGSTNNGQGENFMHRLLDSSSYTVETEVPKGANLTLFNEIQNTRYEFKSLTR